MRKFIETIPGWDGEKPLYISVDRNSYGNIFISINKNKSNITEIEYILDRDEALKLATEIFNNLVSYPDDQVKRLKEGFDCSCKHRLEKNDTTS